MKLRVNRLLRHLKIQIHRIEKNDFEKEFLNNLSDELKSRQLFLSFFGINKLLDVGANIGQYASLMRRIGYQGKIVSFEPLTTAFAELNYIAKYDQNWQCENFALGIRKEKSIIHVSKNSYSSSMLDILPSHIAFDAESKYVSDEIIQIKVLDDVFQNYCKLNDVIMLKIDTQGFERNVLEGTKKSLKKITLIQLEISIEPLYDKEILFVEIVNYMQQIGFDLFALENGIRNPVSGKLLQVDGIFVNKTKINNY